MTLAVAYNVGERLARKSAQTQVAALRQAQVVHHVQVSGRKRWLPVALLAEPVHGGRGAVFCVWHGANERAFACRACDCAQRHGHAEPEHFLRLSHG